MDDDADGRRLTDSELTELALGADPNAPLDADAMPMDVYLAQSPGLLPEWYMPLGLARPVSGWKVPVVAVLVATFLVLEGLGLCTAYGHIVIG
ncbi:MAG TPA: hypothetical protein VG412_08030 [Acidimicrobiales bacterium]|jgi:hypothetical protein|nr:hypothetical protein [Acidimicrobiales bacterium]